jgi:hypothetical protein
MDDHLVPLAGDWALRRDFAVRSAGFPVSGLDAFGAFREALTWQNRGALATAADGLLKDGVKPSRRRQREEVVARYWQRYCSKNDTIGFFGPLAWGEVRDAGPARAARPACAFAAYSFVCAAQARIVAGLTAGAVKG